MSSRTPEEGRRTYRPKRCGNNNKDEDNSPKTLSDKNQQASSQKFKQLITFMFLNFLSSLARSKYMSFFFFLLSLIFTAYRWDYTTTLGQVFWLGSGDLFLFYNISGNFMRLFLWDGFWFMYILFVRMVKFHFLAQFPVDHRSYTLMSCPILLLR